MIRLNVDVGEGYGAWSMGDDGAIMPFVHMASIACGFHASDPVTMLTTLKRALAQGLSIGAHIGYPDKTGFGRRYMAMSGEDLYALALYQMSALDGAARSLGGALDYVKPHGALYHSMMTMPEVFHALCRACSDFHALPALVAQAGPAFGLLQARAADMGVSLMAEAFLDRGYEATGQLVARNQQGALLNESAMLDRARALKSGRGLLANDGSVLNLRFDTLCLHGDHPASVRAASRIRAILDA
jgi:UPF0271 protein